jgi:hypothetical protein
LYNAHAILYSSPKRTLAIVNDGDYSRYLDDFQRAATSWHSDWSDIQLSLRIKSSLFLMFEYLCLYVNAFSFQAALMRSLAASKNNPHIAEPFAGGIMSSPDGLYVLDAITAAKHILDLLNSLQPRSELSFMPSRFYL